MSVSDPLLKELKGYVGKLLEDTNDNEVITDTNPALQPFCETLELIFLKGLNDNFPLRRPDAWYWMENVSSTRYRSSFAFCNNVSIAKENCKTTTARGKFRLLVRLCLNKNVLHEPIDKLVHQPSIYHPYDNNSIIGDEILGQILLSVLLQCSKIKFNLQVKNASFLDETWQLAKYKIYEFVPCKTLGLCVGFMMGKATVVTVEKGSVAEEDDKVEIGDVIDEINGNPLTSQTRGKLSGIMKQAAGKPITMGLIKARFEDGSIYPPLRKIHAKLNLNLKNIEKKIEIENKNTNEVGAEYSPGYSVDYAGKVVVGKLGDVSQIAGAVTKIFPGERNPVQLEILEMGVKVTNRSDGTVLYKHSYMEISSCGRNDRYPSLFAYIAGNDSCNLASEFTCYVFNSKNDEEIVNILQSIDDMGYGDLGLNNVPNLPTNTPNLDSLAKNGIRFLDFHTGASLCTPSRAALLTGRLGLRTGVIENFSPESLYGLPRHEIILPELLHSNGYRTAMFGKWHLGTEHGYHPIDRGFDEYLGVPYSLDMGCTTPPGLDLPERQSCPKEPDIATNNINEDVLALPLYYNKTIVHQPIKLNNLALMYATFARDFILKNSSKPFFLYAAFSHVHVPLAHGEKFKNYTGRGFFADTLAEMDWIALEIANAVKQRKDNTLIWFLSDNGPWEVKCDLAGSSGPFTGLWQKNIGGGGSSSKATVWEAGHRVPSFIYWPNKIKEGQVSDSLLSAMDILPTIATITNIKLPNDRKYDGISIANDLIQNNPIKGHSIMYHPNSGASGKPGTIGAIRIGKYKIIKYVGGWPSCNSSASKPRRLHKRLIFDLNQDKAEYYPISNTTITDKINKKYNEAIISLFLSLWNDKISRADYSTNIMARPCCDHTSYACICPWDK